MSERHVRKVADEIASATRAVDGDRFIAQIADGTIVTFTSGERSREVSRPAILEHMEDIAPKTRDWTYEEEDAAIQVNKDDNTARYLVTVTEKGTIDGVSTVQRSKQEWKIEMIDGTPLITEMKVHTIKN